MTLTFMDGILQHLKTLPQIDGTVYDIIQNYFVQGFDYKNLPSVFTPGTLVKFEALIVKTNHEEEYVPLLADQKLNIYLNTVETNVPINNQFVSCQVHQCTPVPGVSDSEDLVLVRVYSKDVKFKIHDRVIFYGFFDEMGGESSDSDLNNIKHFQVLHYERVEERDELEGHSIIDMRSKVFDCISSIVQDPMKAEMILLSMLSRIHIRKTGLMTSLNIGQMHLNLIVDGAEEAQTIIEMYKALLPRVKVLNVNNETLKAMDFTPRMDFDKNVLIKSPLQVVNHTVLIVDETGMKEGKVMEKELKNIQVLKDFVQHQTLGFDFSYNVDIPVDVPVVVLSVGKSVLGLERVMRLNPKPVDLEPFDSLVKYNSIKFRDLVWNDRDAEVLSNDFVQMRSTNQSYSPQDFGRQMELYRLLLISYGKTEFDESLWRHCIELDQIRA